MGWFAFGFWWKVVLSFLSGASRQRLLNPWGLREEERQSQPHASHSGPASGKKRGQAGPVTGQGSEPEPGNGVFTPSAMGILGRESGERRWEVGELDLWTR